MMRVVVEQRLEGQKFPTLVFQEGYVMFSQATFITPFLACFNFLTAKSSTFGGNWVCCARTLKPLELLETEMCWSVIESHLLNSDSLEDFIGSL